jgi:LuxR family maltose regulon positive regulatory protein
MAAVSMQGSVDVGDFIQNFAGSNRHILDYLLEEVLERQPEDIQAFLLKTSVLNLLNGSLCDTVTGQTGGQAALELLDRTNLFVVSLDDRRFWYRYHHLFSDLLHQRLQSSQPALVPALHLRASEWYEENGYSAEAISHAFSAGEFNRAAGLIEKTADSTLMHGELKTFLSWVERLPEEIACHRPLLCVYHAEALVKW